MLEKVGLAWTELKHGCLEVHVAHPAARSRILACSSDPVNGEELDPLTCA